MQTASAHISRSGIPYAHWSMQVGRDRDAFGEIVDQLADVEQGIANLVLTPKGSVPTEPEKCCDLAAFMDRPPAVAIPALQQEIWETLFVWHKRIKLEQVEVLPVHDDEGGFSHYRVPVFWSPVDGIVEEPIQTELVISDGRAVASGLLQ